MGISSELVSDTDVVNPGIDVYVELDLGVVRLAQGDGRSGIDIDVPDARVKAPVFAKRNIHTGGCRETERVIQVQICFAYYSFKVASSFLIKKVGVVEAKTDLGLPTGAATTRVPLHGQRWGKVLG